MTKNTEIIIFLIVISIIFSPIYNLGVYLRIDQVILLILFPFLFAKSKYMLNRFSIILIVTGLALCCISITNSIISNEVNSRWIINIPGRFIFFALWCASLVIIMKKNQGTRFLYLLSTFLWIVVILLSIIAIVQLLEQLNIIPGMEVNKILAELYPYRKEMSERQLAASSGLQIKRLTMGQSTGTMQGHPIIFGNFMAFSLVFMAALIRSKIHIFLYIIGVIALLTSLSRGAWISYTFGILFFVFILSWPTIKKFILNPSISRNFLKNIFVLLTVLFGTGIVIINTPLYAPLSERISRTQIPIISSEGVPEGRLERVWPKAIESINEAGTLAWFIGIPGGYKHSTDSQYLLLLVNVGIIGIMIFVILHIYIAHLGYIFFQNWWKHDRQIARLGIGLCSAVIMLLFMYIVHPSFQDDKLVYFMFLLFIILRMNLSVSDDAVYRAKKRKFIVFA